MKLIDAKKVYQKISWDYPFKQKQQHNLYISVHFWGIRVNRLSQERLIKTNAIILNKDE
jgi:hypothetical protein